MVNQFCKHPLWQVSKTLSAVATGKQPADLVIRHVNLVNVATRELLENMDVAVSMGRIALVGDGSHCVGESTTVVDGSGKFLAPGFLDGHIHVESAMVPVTQYANAVLPHGTTGIFCDPHEICNVLGLKAVKLMADEGKTTPLKVMVTTPSCVPAVAGFEDIGSPTVTAQDVAETMEWDTVVGTGEMMNFPGILNSLDEPHAIVGAALQAGKIPTGHFSIPETGPGLNAYVAAGLRCCHESTRMEDALAKMRLGMYAQFREGSAWHDLHQMTKVITQNDVDSRFAHIVSDDAHPNTLVSHGHLNYVLKRAVEEGIDPLEAIQMVTINVAQCFQLDHDFGSITPGKCADMVLLDNLTDFAVLKTWVDGDLIAQDGKMLCPQPSPIYPPWATDTIHIAQTITPETFQISAQGQACPTVRVMEVFGGQVPNTALELTVTAKNGLLESDTQADLLKTFVFERHHATGKFGYGLVKGFGIQAGAMASTVAHDAHNLLVVGTNDQDMALAANTLIQSKGGLCVVKDGAVLGHVPLPIAGLMNPAPVEEVAHMVEQLERAWDALGCTMPSPFMTMALIPLACLPELRLTNRGLVDCTTFTLTNFITSK